MIHIIIHILPHEIDQLENLLIQLKRNSVHLPKDHGIKMQVFLNANFVDKEKSQLPIGFFSQKLFKLRDFTKSWAEVEFICDIFNVIWGCNDARRHAIENTTHPYIMYLDSDNVFDEFFLLYTLDFCQKMKGESYHILTPQTTRMWDSTWDMITNYFFLEEEASHNVYDVRDPYEAVMKASVRDRKIKLIPGFKFAGWGTTISTKLARHITIPKELGSYGLDDTFIMACCYIMKEAGIQVNQYVIENEIIIENNKFRFNPYEDYLVSRNPKEEFLKKAHDNFIPELEKFKSRMYEKKDQ